MIKFILKRFYFLFLDILSIPSIFMDKKNNAKYHLKFICPICPEDRKKYRYRNQTRKCWWEDNWKKKNYKISKNFGFNNWIKSYLGIKTNLKKS